MDWNRERKRLLDRDAEWAMLASEGADVDRIVSYWSEDAVVIPPRMAPLQGRSAIADYVRSSLKIPGFRITWNASDAVLSPDGRFGYMVGTNEVTLSGPDGAPMKVRGRAVTIWRRDEDGEWRCVVDIWNEEPTGAASSRP